MKIWQCYSGLAAQTWYLTDDNRIALMNQGLYISHLWGSKMLIRASRRSLP